MIRDMPAYRKLKPMSCHRAPKQKPANLPNYTPGGSASAISQHYKDRNELGWT